MRIALFIRSLMLVVGMLVLSTASFAQISVGLSVNLAPPELPVYEQPICPEDGDIWTPGYWAYGDDGYFWVPGDWVMAPEVGFLWTPGYWGWGGNAFLFHEGYWGSEIGFYGGVNYGFGYGGFGYEGGRWDNGHFAYNRSVNNINVSISRNTYNTTVVNRSESRVSFNGGTGGIAVRATAQENAAATQRHIAPVAAQTERVQSARANPELRNSANHGKPSAEAIAKSTPSRAAGEARTAPAAENRTERPTAEAPRANTEAARPAAEAARPAAETARPAAEAARPTPVVHARDIQAPQHVAATPSGNAKQDQKYAQQQQKMENQQAQERQKLQTKQDSDHQRQTQQKASAAQTQQLEQRHQQQTQQLSQKHAQQQQQMQQRAPAPQHQASAAAPRAEGKKP